MAGYFLPPNGPTTVILADNRDWHQSWRNHVARGSSGGVDLVAAPGTPVYAPADGTVQLTRWNGTGGHTITLHQSGGWRDQFMHLREPNPAAVANGTFVRQGQLIGWTGRTASGMIHGVAQHLHWHRIDPSGVRRNPKDYFGPAQAGGGTTPLNNYGYGLTTEAQRVAQQALQKLGLYGGAIDGVFGGVSVKGMQQYLKNVGLLDGGYVVDGVPGPTYGKAVQQLAAKHGYTGPIDGDIGAATSGGIVAWANSINVSAPAPAPAQPSAPVEGYAYGLSTDAMRAVQEALDKLDLYGGAIDGAFGVLSVKSFQQYLKNVDLLPPGYVVDGQPGELYGKAVQNLAARHGYDGPIDGVPGGKTSAALITWAASVTGNTTPTPPVVTPPVVQPEPETPTPQPTGLTFGIDIASPQKDIDLARVKAEGAQFVIVKMGGLNVTPQYVAPYYKKQVDAAKAQGLYVGHYYLIGRGQTPEQQADYFVENLHNFDVNKDVLALDNEKLDGNGVLWSDDDAARFIARVIERTGIHPARVWHYAGASDYRNHKPWTKVAATGARFWWAAYGNGPSGRTPDHTPDLQGSIPDWSVHQYSSRVQIAGYALDGNVSRLKVEDLFAKGTVVTPPVEPEPEPETPAEPETPQEPTPTDPVVPPVIVIPPAPVGGDEKARSAWLVHVLYIIGGLVTSIIAFLTGTSQ